jgi:hypothetical protein
MRISEAKTLLFEKVVGLNIACACSVSISDTPIIILRLNSEEDRQKVAKKILFDKPHFQGHALEIIVVPVQGRRAKQ